jgi:hypothetical protein
MVRLAVLIFIKTYLLAPRQPDFAVDLRAFRGIANPLQDGSLSCICPSNYKDPEFDVWPLHFFPPKSLGKRAKQRENERERENLIDGWVLFASHEVVRSGPLSMVDLRPNILSPYIQRNQKVSLICYSLPLQTGEWPQSQAVLHVRVYVYSAALITHVMSCVRHSFVLMVPFSLIAPIDGAAPIRWI